MFEYSPTSNTLSLNDLALRLDTLESQVKEQCDSVSRDVPGSLDEFNEQFYEELLDKMSPEYDEEEFEEYFALLRLKDDVGGAWNNDTIIHESYVLDWTQQFVDEVITDIPSWIVIDLDATWENLRLDYSRVWYDDEIFYSRTQ